VLASAVLSFFVDVSVWVVGEALVIVLATTSRSRAGAPRVDLFTEESVVVEWMGLETGCVCGVVEIEKTCRLQAVG